MNDDEIIRKYGAEGNGVEDIRLMLKDARKSERAACEREFRKNPNLIAIEDKIQEKYLKEVYAWQHTPNRRAASAEWTASLYRQIGYLIEIERYAAEKDGAKKERARLAEVVEKKIDDLEKLDVWKYDDEKIHSITTEIAGRKMVDIDEVVKRAPPDLIMRGSQYQEWKDALLSALSPHPQKGDVR